MKYGKLSLGQIEALVNKLGGMEGVEQILRDEFEVVVKAKNFIIQAYSLVVNYNVSIKELVRGYDFVESDITDNNFGSSKKGEERLEVALFHFLGKSTMTKEAIAEMKSVNYRPATMKELLTFGKKYPELQRKYFIIGPNSVRWPNYGRRVGYLSSKKYKLGVGWDDYGSNWADDDHCLWFLGVHVK